MSILIFLIISYILLSISLMKVFEKAGEAGWKALVPGLNFVVMARLIGRSGWHAAWLLFPIVNIFIYVGLCVQLVRSFGKYKFEHAALAVIFAPAIFFYLGYSSKEKYEGPSWAKERDFNAKLKDLKSKGDKYKVQKLERKNPYKKSQGREWTEAIIFAVFAAAFIRMFLIEAYKIPTSSMEGSLLVGDFLFVSKAHYGIRTPKTVLMIPLLHNVVPLVGGESYIEEPNLPMTRLPALEEIDRNEPIVFNFPEGDSVYVFADRTWSIYDYRRGNIQQQSPTYHRAIKNGTKKLITRPIDKKDHYIKRCIAIAGDKIEIKDQQVYVNDKPQENPTNIQFRYLVSSPKVPINRKQLDQFGVNLSEISLNKNPSKGIYNLTNKQVEQIKAMDENIVVERYPVSEDPTRLFPHDPKHFPDWTIDNYGPVVVPKKGQTVELKPENIALYKRIINVYEDNDFEMKDGQYTINGQPATSYTFKQDYYWAMGDNRHNSEDSRFWGFVPADHIVGKPLFIWFSTKNGSMSNGIHWDRLFTSAHKM